MYALTIVECETYEHARALRALLERIGFPSVAATAAIDRDTLHVLLTAAPHRYPETLSGMAAVWSERPEALSEIATDELRLSNEAVPSAQRDTVREALMASLFYAADRVIACDPPQSDAVHDPGDESPTRPTRRPNTIDDQWRPLRDAV